MESDQTSNRRRNDQSLTETLPTNDGTDRAVASFLDEHRETIAAAPQLSVDALFQQLAHPGRRYVLTYMLQSDGVVSCSDLIDYVVSKTDPAMTPAAFRDGVASELTHTHLPRLERDGLVEYDVERQLISTTELTPVVAPYLEFAMAQDGVRRRAIE